MSRLCLPTLLAIGTLAGAISFPTLTQAQDIMDPPVLDPTLAPPPLIGVPEPPLFLPLPPIPQDILLPPLPLYPPDMPNPLQYPLPMDPIFVPVNGEVFPPGGAPVGAAHPTRLRETPLTGVGTTLTPDPFPAPEPPPLFPPVPEPLGLVPQPFPTQPQDPDLQFPPAPFLPQPFEIEDQCGNGPIPLQEGVGLWCILPDGQVFAMWDRQGDGQWDYGWGAESPSSPRWDYILEHNQNGPEWDYVWCRPSSPFASHWEYFFCDMNGDGLYEYSLCNSLAEDPTWDYFFCDMNNNGHSEYALCESPFDPDDNWDYWFCDMNENGYSEYRSCNIEFSDGAWDYMFCDENEDGLDDYVWCNQPGGGGWTTLLCDENQDGVPDVALENPDDDPFWNIQGLDTNGDGKFEYLWHETPGIPDPSSWDYALCRGEDDVDWRYVFCDDDLDGDVNYAWCSTNADGSFQYAFCDLDGDGNFDYAFYDENSDGRSEYAFCDFDRDDRWDYVFCDEISQNPLQFRYIYCAQDPTLDYWEQVFCDRGDFGPYDMIWTDIDGDGIVDTFYSSDAPAGNDGGLELPGTLALFQNAPNPFRENTRINFDLPESAARVRVDIFDSHGRRIRSIADRPMTAGRHTLSWDALDENRRPVASGVYFYKLTTDGQAVTRRMDVIR